MSLIHPFTVLVLLLGGAVFVPRLHMWLSRSARAFATPIVAGCAFLLTIGMTWRAAPLHIDVSPWAQAPYTEEGITFTMTASAQRFTLLALFIILAVTLGALDEKWDAPSDEYRTAVLAIGAALMAFVMADTFLTWLATWIFLDLVWLFVIGLPGWSDWPLEAGVTQGAGFFCLLVAVLLLWREYGTVAFHPQGVSAFSESIAVWVMIALALRMAVFPLHLFARTGERIPGRIRAIAPLVVVGGGGYWLLYWARAWGIDWVTTEVVIVLALGMSATGLLAWRSTEATGRTAALMAWLTLIVIWAILYERYDMAAAFIWSGSLALAALGLHGGEGPRFEGSVLPGIFVPASIAAFAFLGVPGSAMRGIGWLSGAALARGHVWLAAGSIIGVAGVTVALLPMVFAPAPATHQRTRWMGMMLLSLAAWPAVGRLLALYPTVQVEPEIAVPARLSFGLLLLAWAGGLLLWRARHLLIQVEWLFDWGVHAISLTWVYNWMARLVWSGAGVIRGAVRVLEGENYGWLLFFLLVTFLFLAQ